MTINEAMRLIDADALKHHIQQVQELSKGMAAVIATLSVVEEMIDYAPTVSVRQWISVEDRLPEDKQRVLVYSPFNVGSDVGPIAVQSGWMCKNKNHGITHWMPLPEPPEAGDNNA